MGDAVQPPSTAFNLLQAPSTPFNLLQLPSTPFYPRQPLSTPLNHLRPERRFQETQRTFASHGTRSVLSAPIRLFQDRTLLLQLVAKKRKWCNYYLVEPTTTSSKMILGGLLCAALLARASVQPRLLRLSLNVDPHVGGLDPQHFRRRELDVEAACATHHGVWHTIRCISWRLTPSVSCI